MAENKLTDKALRAIKAGAKEQTIGDGGGLWVRVLPSPKGGSISFYYRFLHQGKEHRYNCGSYPETSLAEARKTRNAARDDVKAGINPLHKLALNKAEAAAAITNRLSEKTVDDLFDDWHTVYLKTHQKDGGALVKAAYDLDVGPTIGHIKARDVRLPHIVLVIDRLLSRGVRRKANMVLSQMRQMFRHGMGRGIVDTDPTLGMSRKQAGGKEAPVTRNLSLAEIKELLEKLPNSGLSQQLQLAVKLILTTGARVGEIVSAEWSQVDLKTRTWVIPADTAKNGRAHLVHLSDFAIRQLQTLEKTRSTRFLLSGRKPDTHLDGQTLTKAVRDRTRTAQINKRAPATGALILTGGEWSPHDLRRTMASRMGDLGVPPHVIERCLNHIQQGIVGVYQQQEYLTERKQAYESWGATLDSCERPTP